MRFNKKILSMILVFVMILGLLPAASFATAAGEEDVVYLSISFDGEYISDKNGNLFAYMPVPISAFEKIDLAEYGLDNMLYDGDGDGEYDTTALQLLIYAHEELWGGDWSEVTFDALPGSSYFRGGIFGFTENLVYFLNGDFPVDESQQSDFMTVGATSDRIVLEAGDFIDIASFSCYSFLWDQLGGFHLFADTEDNYVHSYSMEAGETLDAKLLHSFCDLMFGEGWLKGAEYYEIFYGTTYGDAIGTLETDEEGNFSLTIDEPGTYYLWCYGGNGSEDGTHTTCDYYSETGTPCIVSAPAYAILTVEGGEEPEPAPEEPRAAQDVSEVLNATLAKQVENIPAPAFGTNYGEWTVFGLARGGYFEKGYQYFEDYYARIVEYVNTTAGEINLSGALDKNKSTDNSRLIMALSSIGKNSTTVGNWDLVEAYSANGINWIRKQGMNGTIWTLIALDTGNFETSDPTIRQQCVDAIVSAQHNDGGWSLVTAKTQPSNVDITGMTLTALYPYRDQPAVAAACETAIQWLSDSQLENGGFPYGQGETSESCAWAIVAATTWGINPDTDPRFIKNGNSAIDNLLTYYVEEEAMFEHGRGAGVNAMATDQAAYALVAYDRFINNEPSLYDYSDVVIDEPTPAPETDEMIATIGLPAQINGADAFNGVISINKWDNEGAYKLIDFIVEVPEGIDVTDVSAGSRLAGGEISWNLEADTGLLRVVYFDANENTDLTITGEEFPAELFTISFKAMNIEGGEKINIGIGGMSVKLSSDSSDEKAMIVVDTENEKASGEVEVVVGISYSAVCLYTGDNIDLIPEAKKAIAVAVTGIVNGTKLSYNDGTNAIDFNYSAEITEKTGISSYVALVDTEIATENFANEDYFTIPGGEAPAISFGDTNSDGTINAQDALNIVNSWLRIGEELADNDILVQNVNGDSRINTFDALGIVEKFVNGADFGVVTKAATIKD
ncbi:MAG: hypothetical protein IKV79_04105 [Oscillospiraceae bacterium]|nr:hypothetical protein [Oscillospiraceae bacterium]